jgi:hypothetical protein
MIRLVCPAAVVAAALVGCSPKVETSPAAPAAPTATVKAGDLLKEYAANAIAADGKYKGKVIQISGKYGSVQKLPLMGYVLQLQSDDAEGGSLVQCTIEKSAEEDVGKVQPGQAITLQGTCDGQVLPGQIKMSKCTVVK